MMLSLLQKHIRRPPFTIRILSTQNSFLTTFSDSKPGTASRFFRNNNHLKCRTFSTSKEDNTPQTAKKDTFTSSPSTFQEADIVSEVVATYEHDEEYKTLMQHHQKLLQSQSSSDVSQKLLESFRSLANYHWDQNNLPQSQSYYEEELTHLLHHHGRNAFHPDIAICLHKLGTIQAQRGHPLEAIKWYTKSLEMKQNVFGEDHLEVAKTLNGMAMLHAQVKEMEDQKLALKLFRDAEQIMRKELGENHEDLLVILENLVNLHRQYGDWEGSLEWYYEILRIHEVRGNEEGVISARMSVGDCLYNLDRLNEAKEEFDEAMKLVKALEMKTTNQEEEEECLAMKAVIYHNFGLIYSKKGEYDMAIAQFEASREIKLKVVGKDHPEVANTLNCMGAIYGTKMEREKALAFFQESLRIFRVNSIEGDDDPNVVNTLGNIALVRKSMVKR